jgi:YesN/AraC family two-component response regulator
MYSELVAYIMDFCRFQKEENGFNITVNFFREELEHCFFDIMPIYTHKTPPCICAKSNGELAQKCAAHYARVENSRFDVPFTTTCFCGVAQTFYPIWAENEPIAYVSVDDYRPGLDETEKRTFSADAVVRVLSDMIRFLYAQNKDLVQSNIVENDLYGNMLKYIHLNFAASIKPDDMETLLNCRKSYLSYIFSRKSRYAFKKYVNLVRMEYAKILLVETNMPITEIAYTVGYSDSNYFTKLYKNAYGVPPRRFRASIGKRAVLNENFPHEP